MGHRSKSRGVSKAQRCALRRASCACHPCRACHHDTPSRTPRRGFVVKKLHPSGGTPGERASERAYRQIAKRQHRFWRSACWHLPGISRAWARDPDLQFTHAVLDLWPVDVEALDVEGFSSPVIPAEGSAWPCFREQRERKVVGRNVEKCLKWHWTTLVRCVRCVAFADGCCLAGNV